MRGNLQSLRRHFIVIVTAVFVGVPLGLVFLNIFAATAGPLTTLTFVAVFAATGAFLGSWLAGALERGDAERRRRMETEPNAGREFHRGREQRVQAGVIALGAIFIISLFYEAAHDPYASAAWAGLSAVLFIAMVFLFFFVFSLSARNNSEWTKRFCFLLFLIPFTNFVIGAATLLKQSGAASIPSTTQAVYQGRGNAVTLGAYGTRLGAVTVVLPAGFEIVPVDADSILIRPTGSAATAEVPSLVVGETSSSFQAVLGRQRALLAQAHYSESTTTFSGFSADSISFAQTNGQERAVVSAVVFEANGSTFDVAETRIVSPASYEGADDTLQEILKSMKFSAR